MSDKESQLAATVLMIRPQRFASNPMTSVSNRFQRRSTVSAVKQQAMASREFEDLVTALRDAGIAVIDLDDTPQPHTPDSLFPNNWVSFHADGRVVLYPMEAENRRTERRSDIIEKLDSEFGFRVSDIVDLSGHEANGHFLEGTGSMVLDRENRIAYACLSSRTQLDPLGDFAQRMDYEVLAFDALDRDGIPIYHTNVLMNVGEAVAVICDEAIARKDQRNDVLNRLQETGKDIVRLTFDQLGAFAGNMLELTNAAGERVLTMSQRAWNSLDGEQRRVLEANGRVVAVPVNSIEASAGGSVRCMLAEIHLPTSG